MMKKTSEKSVYRETSSIDNDHTQNRQANKLAAANFSSQRECLSSKIRHEARISTLITLIKHDVGRSSWCKKLQEEDKNNTDRKEIQVSLYLDGIIIHTENSKESVKTS